MCWNAARITDAGCTCSWWTHNTMTRGNSVCNHGIYKYSKDDNLRRLGWALCCAVGWMHFQHKLGLNMLGYRLVCTGARLVYSALVTVNVSALFGWMGARAKTNQRTTTTNNQLVSLLPIVTNKHQQRQQRPPAVIASWARDNNIQQRRATVNNKRQPQPATTTARRAHCYCGCEAGKVWPL